MVKKLRINESNKKSRPIRERRSVTIEYLDFNELSEEQKKQAVDKFINSDTAYEWFNDDQMIMYNDEVQYLADQLVNKTGIEANPDKLYWQCSSQGPYPEWDFNNVFERYAGTVSGHDVDVAFYGKGRDVEFGAVWVYTDGDYEQFDADDFATELRDTGLEDVADGLDNLLGEAQEFIDSVWRLVNNVCTSYPDEEWAYDTLEANDYEFEVDSNGNVVKMA